MVSTIILFIVFPMTVGFVMQRYKTAKVTHFALFIISFFILLKPVFFFLYGGSFIPDLFEISLSIGSVMIACLLFYVQKRIVLSCEKNRN